MKNAIRNQMREKRQALSPALHAEKSKKIREMVEQLPEFKNAKKILIYVSIGEEVDTHELIKDALTQGRALFVPKTKPDGIAVTPLKDWADLKPGTFGVLEPETQEEADPQEMDLIIVPGLAFDAHGHRIGYGKGYYDRLLKLSLGYTVGLAFTEQMVEKIPHEAHDVPLNLVLTS
ncbi:MAG: 5-formyltetrahydrofolate cyclo-ligase [Candidatus Gracilibacteria bacterium]|jgi:5-formyltetrahydrofolate cyclo-ligase